MPFPVAENSGILRPVPDMDGVVSPANLVFGVPPESDQTLASYEHAVTPGPPSETSTLVSL